MPPVCHEGLGQPVRVPSVGSQPIRFPLESYSGSTQLLAPPPGATMLVFPFESKKGVFALMSPFVLGKLFQGSSGM